MIRTEGLEKDDMCIEHTSERWGNDWNFNSFLKFVILNDEKEFARNAKEAVYAGR